MTYSDISNTALLMEIAAKRGGYVPDLSFGTHFFQDLVESGIRYLPLYPDDAGVVFNEPFLLRVAEPSCASCSRSSRTSPASCASSTCRASGAGRCCGSLMNADLDEAIGFLGPPSATQVAERRTDTEQARDGSLALAAADGRAHRGRAGPGALRGQGDVRLRQHQERHRRARPATSTCWCTWTDARSGATR